MHERGKPSALTITAVNTFAFALSFAVWVMLGPSARALAKQLGLSEATVALVKSAPILVGSVMRIPVGLLADRLGARRTFALVQVVGAIGALALSFAGGLGGLIGGGLVLGFVGTTFVVGVQSVSSWTPPARQGFALGVFGSGNVGTALTTFAMPLLVASIGWRAGFRIYGASLLACAALYYAIVRDAGAAPARTLGAMLAPLKSPRALRFGLYYMATFGAFVATTLTVSDLYVDVYAITPKTAGLLATTFTLAASLVRAVGGRLADAYGARAVMRASLFVIVLAAAPVAFLPPLAVTVALVFVAGLAMGVGAAATFKYIPQFFPSSVGAVRGIVGALGGVGGFFLPMLSAWVKTRWGTPAFGLLPIVALATVAGVAQAIAARPVEKPGLTTLTPSVPPPR